jgi:hypothetical protein
MSWGISTWRSRFLSDLTKLFVVFGFFVLMSGLAVGHPQAVEEKTAPYTPGKPNVVVNRKGPTPQPATPEASDWDRFRKSRQPEQLLSSTIDNDHEDAGIETAGEPTSSGTKVYSGVFAVHAVYRSDAIHLAVPPAATRTQTLFAATTRPPNGSCLEVGTSYTTEVGAATTTAAVYVFDFCKPNHPDWGLAPFPTGGQVPMYVDASFMATYAGGKIHDVPAYTVHIFTKDLPLSADSVWYAQLYNYKTKNWDTLYQSKGLYDLDPRGWSIFETWFQQGQCSESLPAFGAEQLAYYNSSTGKWDAVVPQMSTLKNYVSRGGSQNNNCFTDDHTGPASYTIQAVPPGYSGWKVVSR